MKDGFDYIYGCAFLFLSVFFAYVSYVNWSKDGLDGFIVVFALPFSVLACIAGVYYFRRSTKSAK